VQREIQERKLFDEWKRERTGGTAAGSASGAPAAGSADIGTAQRYLIALGYYNGKADGVAGASTRAAVQRFQSDRGLSPTGTVTPELVQEMRRAL
jgi:peptidoglycan hydrolase-like protein with peptidoglycan-binding domain